MNSRRLCRIDEIPDGGTLRFPPPKGGFTGLFAWRNAASVRVYVNACPHLGLPLDTPVGQFLDAAGQRFVCAMHGARFLPATGACEWGPCKGDALESVPVTIVEGCIEVPADAGL